MVLGSLVYVRYLDHVLFKYSSPFRYRPIERETVGWLVKQDDEAVWIVADRSVESLKHQLDSDSGLIILKSDILKMKHLGKSYRLNIVRQIEILAEYALQEKEVKNSVQR